MNSSWYSVKLSAGQVAAGKLADCAAAFEKAFAAAHGPRTMALFQRKQEDGVALFLTPVCAEHAAELLEEWGCTPCERPSLIDLHLVVGHHEITYYMP